MKAFLVMVLAVVGCGDEVDVVDAHLATTVQAASGANDAPVLDAAKSPVFDPMLAGGAPVGAVGTPVSTLVDFATPSGQIDNVTDADNTDGDGPALLGMAVIGADATKGTWWYTLDGGANWQLLGAPTASAARLLDASARLYFQPISDFGGTIGAAVTFCAWDRTSGTAGGTADTTTNGGTTAFSTATDSAMLTVVAISLRSVSSAGATASPATLTLNKTAGVTVRDTLVAAIAVEPAAATITPPAGWALLERATGVNNSLATYTKLAGAEPATYAFTLTGATAAAGGIQDYFNVDTGAPVDDWGGHTTASSLMHDAGPETATGAHTEIVTWHSYASAGTWTPPTGMTEGIDVTSEAATGDVGVSLEGSYVSMAAAGLVAVRTATASNDADTGATEMVVLRLSTLNNAPVLDAAKSPMLAAELQNAPAPVGAVGTLVSSLVDFPGGGGLDNLFDVDVAQNGGIAIVGADTTNGSWWYSTNNGTTWTALGAVTATPGRLLSADATTRLYFQPTAGFSGTISSALTFRAWDRSSGTNGSVANVIPNGGITPFSLVTDTASLTITAPASAPTATNLSAPETYTEDMPLDLVDIVASDADSPNLTATLTLSSTGVGSLSTATSGTVTSTFAGGVWTASGPIANVNTLLAGVTFTPTANSNASFTIATNVSDGTSFVAGTKAVTGTAVDDPPTATNLSAPQTYTEDTPLDLIDIVASDIDSANVTATLTVSNVAAGSLSTGTSGAVTSTYVPATGVWTASGAIANVNVLLANVLFMPAPNFNGNFTIATSVADATTAVTGTKAITGTPVDDPPIAVDDTAMVEAGAAVVIDVAANDHDPDDALDLTSVTLTSTPSHGTVTIAANGTVTYTHDGSSSTSDTFTYKIRDAAATLSNAATVTLTITPSAVTPDGAVTPPDAGVTPDAGGSPPSDSGCGCQSGGSGGSWPVLVIAILVVRRRCRPRL